MIQQYSCCLLFGIDITILAFTFIVLRVDTLRERERCSALSSPQLCQCISSQHSRCCCSDDDDDSLRPMLCSAILIILSSLLPFFNVITMGSILGAQQLLCIVISTITQHWLSKVLQGIRCRKSVAVRVVSLVEFPF